MRQQWFVTNGVFTGSGTLTFLSNPAWSFNAAQWFIEAGSPNFTGNIVIGNSSANSGSVQCRPGESTSVAVRCGTITINGGGAARRQCHYDLGHACPTA